MSDHEKSMSNHSLSVVIPVGFAFDGLKKLEFSIAAGSTEPEYIIVNDLACEDSSELIRDLISRNHNHNINSIDGFYGAPGIARNAGMEKVSNAFIQFADSDDVFYVNEILDKLKELDGRSDVIIGNFRTRIVQDDSVREFHHAKPGYLTVGNNPGLWRMIIRASLAKSETFSKLRMAEDQVYLAKLNLFNLEIEYANAFFYEYSVQSQGSLTSQNAPMRNLLPALKEIMVLIDDTFTESNYFKAVILIKVFFANVKRGKFKQKMSSIYLLNKFSCSSVRKFLIVSMLLLRLLKSRYEEYNEL
jgi:glycosyltransferase involved in cell wall biosynthesis